MNRNHTIMACVWICCVTVCFITGHDDAGLLILFVPLIIAWIS